MPASQCSVEDVPSTDYSTKVSCFLLWVFAFDSMVSYISIFKYWGYEIDGHFNLYGAIVSCYDVLQLLGVYFFFRLQKCVSYKVLYVTGVLASIVGNLLYAVAYQGDSRLTQQLKFIISRVVAGLGSGCQVVALAQLTDGVRSHQAGVRSYRFWVSCGRFVGPLVGWLSLRIPSFNISLNESVDVLNVRFDYFNNFVVLSVLLHCLLLVAIFLDTRKTKGEEEPVSKPVEELEDPLIGNNSEEPANITDDKTGGFVVHRSGSLSDLSFSNYAKASRDVLSANFISTAAFWIFFIHLIPITILRYDVSEIAAGNVYAAAAAGTLLSAVCIRFAFPASIREETIMLIGGVASCLAYGVLFKFTENRDYLPLWIVGITIVCFGSNLSAMMSLELFTKEIEESSSFLLLMTIYVTVSVLARFFGASIGSALLQYEVDYGDSGEGSAANDDSGISFCNRTTLDYCDITLSSMNVFLSTIVLLMMSFIVLATLIRSRRTRISTFYYATDY